jgi:phage terminase large subunit-like protein
MQASSQRLQRIGLPMCEFPQTIPNLTEASTNLYEAVKGQNIVAYPDEAIRLAMQRCVACETSRGWKISKEKNSHKIDVVIALGMAALGAVQCAEQYGRGEASSGMIDGVMPDRASGEYGVVGVQCGY